MVSQLRRAVRALCPPAVWHAARACYRFANPPKKPAPTCVTVTTLAEVDERLNRARDALASSTDESFAILDGFQLAYPTDLPADPYSPEYRDCQMRFYRFLSD